MSANSVESAYQSTKSLLTSQKVTALFTTNYELTLGAIIAINELSLKIPEDISFVGFDNIQLSRIINPKLTMVCQPILRLGRKTAGCFIRTT